MNEYGKCPICEEMKWKLNIHQCDNCGSSMSDHRYAALIFGLELTASLDGLQAYLKSSQGSRITLAHMEDMGTTDDIWAIGRLLLGPERLQIQDYGESDRLAEAIIRLYENVLNKEGSE